MAQSPLYPLFSDVLSTPAAENFLSQIIENIPDMIFVKEAKDLRFVMFNRAGEELLGYWREDLIGKNDFDFFSAQEGDFFIFRDPAVPSRGTMVGISQETDHNSEQSVRGLHSKQNSNFC